MGILWVLMAVVMLGAVLGPYLLRRRGGIRQVAPGSPDAADPAEYGFMRQEDLDVRLPGPDQDLLNVMSVVQRNQDFTAAKQLLAGTGKETEQRWERVQAIAGAAALELAQTPRLGAGWLHAWRAQEPKDPGGAQVFAEFLVQQAWRNAGGEAQADERRIILEEARSACEDAALLAPGDPVPHITHLAVARGLGYSQHDFEQLWLKILDTAPGHMGAHLAGLRYWCEKWHGSRELAFAFAEAAAARAPRGSLLAALPSSRSTSTCPRSIWCAASTRARSSPSRSTARSSPSRPPARTTRCSPTSATSWCSSWSAASAGPRRWSSCSTSTAMSARSLDDGHGPGRGLRGVPGAGGRGLRGERREPGDAAPLTLPRARGGVPVPSRTSARCAEQAMQRTSRRHPAADRFSDGKAAIVTLAGVGSFISGLAALVPGVIVT